MSEKIMCAAISFNDGDRLIVRLKDWKEYVIEMDSVLSAGESGDGFTVLLLEMDECEYKKLPEYNGF